MCRSRITIDNVHHVVPASDLRPHDTNHKECCECCPRIQPVYLGEFVVGYVIVHHRFDGVDWVCYEGYEPTVGTGEQHGT